MSAAGAAPDLSKARELIQSLPIRFEPNTGQWNSRVRFFARTADSRLLLTAQEAELSAGDSALSLSLVQANPAPRIEGLDPLPVRANYFIGRRGDWRTDVPQYRRVRYAGVYPGIDLVYYGNASRLEYDLMLHPGADAGRIRLQFRGAGRLSLSDSGDLLLDTGSATVVQKRPVIYQETAPGERREIAGRYRLLGKDVVGVELGAYDRSRALTIDPVLVYSSLVGGAGSDAIVGLKVDKSGMVWVAGNTAHTANGGDVTPPNTDASFQAASGGGTNIFLAKFNPQAPDSSSLAYFTYIGGSGTDTLRGMAMDGAGNIYLTGSTTSTDFPLGGAAFQNGLNTGSGTDAFVVKFNSNATGADQMAYSSYFGGADDDIGYGIDVDAAGAIYVVGTTRSHEDTFPLTASSAYAAQLYGSQDAFIAKFDLTQSSTLVYSSFLGGELQDEGRAVAVTPSGTVYIAGSTESTGFPQAGNQYRSTLSGYLDGWIAQMDLTRSGVNSLVYSTYIGGGDLDEIRKIAIDPSGKLLVTGYTMSADFPVTPNAFQMKLGGNADAFVARVNLAAPPDSFLDYSTFLGGSDGESGYDIVADKSGNIYVTGYTLSKNFPVAGNPLSAAWKGGTEVFFSRLDPKTAGAGALTYSSYLGELGNHAGNGIAAGSDGSIYVGGYTNFQDILATANAGQPNYGGGLSDGFLIIVGP